MRHILAILIAIGALVMGFRLLLVDTESPTYRLARAFTVDEPRCLICNRPAVAAPTFEHFTDRRGENGIAIEHPMCARHNGTGIGYFIWPHVDKYLLMVLAIGLYLAGIFAGVIGVYSVFATESLGASLGAPLFLLLGHFAKDLLTRVA